MERCKLNAKAELLLIMVNVSNVHPINLQSIQKSITIIIAIPALLVLNVTVNLKKNVKKDIPAKMESAQNVRKTNTVYLVLLIHIFTVILVLLGMNAMMALLQRDANSAFLVLMENPPLVIMTSIPTIIVIMTFFV